MWEFEPRWLNPDVVGSNDGFKEQPQIAFPEQLLGTLLAPNNRAGQRYCAEFQNGSCANGDSCRLGFHKCAAVFRGGRTCHRNHAGSQCWDQRKQTLQQSTDQQGVVQSVANAVEPAGKGKDKGVKRILPREALLGESLPRCRADAQFSPWQHQQGAKSQGPLCQWTCHRLLWHQYAGEKPKHSRGKG